MTTWWSAIDTRWSSYIELKHRKVIAQGWNALGDLTSLLGPVSGDKEKFIQIVQILGDAAYAGESWWQKDRQESRTPAVMWKLLSLKQGDLVVAVEGTTVKGICQLERDALNSYSHQPAYEYAQTIGFPVRWVDWKEEEFGFVPKPPSHGVLGIAGLQDESLAVKNAWRINRS